MSLCACGRWSRFPGVRIEARREVLSTAAGVPLIVFEYYAGGGSGMSYVGPRYWA